MSERSHGEGLEVYLRGKVEKNTKGFNTDQTVSVQGAVIMRTHREGQAFSVLNAEGREVPIGDVIDALHEEIRRANNREIDRQRQQQLAELRAA